MTQVAVIGAGLIGRAWSIVFARAGFDVALWDPYPQQVDAALAFIGERLPELKEVGLLKEASRLVARRVRPVGTLAEAVASADHVQENGPERVDAKQALFGELDQLTSPDTVLASSTSGIPASALSDSAGRTVPGTVDRSCSRVSNARPDDQCGPGASDSEQGDGRVRAEPAAGRTSGRGVPADRR
jgi:3-hydroxyacyl-CoA dehydrogenase